MSPFDEARYARLLEGLDATEITLPALLQWNEVFRIDAEYFGTEELAVIGRLRSLGAVPLATLATITDGIHTSLPFVDDGAVKVLSAKHPKENYIDRSQFETITAEFHAQNPRTALREDDVLISTVGTIGNSAVVTADVLPANSDRHIGIIRLHMGVMSPYVLSTFLLGKYGKTQSVRETTGNVQPNLFISKIGQLLIARFSEQFEKTLAANVQRAYRLREASAEQLGQAEKVLVDTLGLDGWEAPDPLAYIRSSCDAFAAGRLDSEFFTPRVRDMLTRLGRDGLKIRDVAPARKERFMPSDSGDFNYIEIGGLGADGTAQAECLQQQEAPSRATQFVRAGDVITSTVRPIRRLSAAIDKSQDGHVCSSGFVVLQPRAISSDVLLTYLRLPPVCALMDLHTSASMYPAISEADLLALPIPEIPAATQRAIEKSVLAARQAKQCATQLLDTAKRAVEIAIEQNEKSALVYLESKV